MIVHKGWRRFAMTDWEHWACASRGLALWGYDLDDTACMHGRFLLLRARRTASSTVEGEMGIGADRDRERGNENIVTGCSLPLMLLRSARG